MASSQAAKKRKIDDGFENPYVSPRAKNFYLSTDSADVYFICDGSNGERIPAHKVIMSIGTDAFNAMFHGGLRESGDIRIVDASAEAFKEFLKFFYFDNVTLTMDHIEEIVYLCTKYVYSSSIKICEEFLLKFLSIENVCFSYGLAITYDLVKLKQKCEEIIIQNTLAVFQTADFLECDKSVLAEILKLDRLSCLEIDVFNGCMAWVKVAAMQEKVTRQLINEKLGSSFNDIRFGSMTNEHLTGLLSEYGDLFAIDEYKEIDQLISSNHFHSPLFKREPRLFPWNEHNAIKWPFHDPECYGWTKFHEFESSIISTKKHILLGEIVLRKIFTVTNKPIDLLIFEKSTIDDGKSRIILQQQIELNDSFQLISVRLRKELILSPNFEYEIQLKIGQFPSNVEYLASSGYHELMSKIIDCDMIKIRNSSDVSLIYSLNVQMISKTNYRL